MLTAANLDEPTETLVRVRVTRAFHLRGEPQAIGTELQVNVTFARELANVGKAVILDPLPEGPRSACSTRRDELWKAKLP